jgi:hypothetical protein
MKMVSRTDRKVIIQVREFKRQRSSKEMKLTLSRSLTLHDAQMQDVYQKVKALFDEEEGETAAAAAAS